MPHCGNTNMRRMYLEVSVTARRNLVTEIITTDIRPFNIDNIYDPIYCAVCNQIVEER